MSIVKNLGLKLALLVFGLGIFGLAVSFSINHVFGTPDNLKSSLQEGEVYEMLASEIADQLVNNATAREHTPINDDALKDAAHTAITPEFVKEHSEKIIDGTYSWLDGSTPTPEFRIDTGAIQQQLTASLSQSALDRVQGLPACTPAQLQRLAASAQDPFSLPCRPPGMNAATIRQQIEASMPGDSMATGGETINASDTTNDQGQNLFAQADKVPGMFQLGQKLPWTFGILAILTAALIIFLNDSHRRGVKSLSISLLITGALLLVFTIIASLIFQQVGASIGSINNEAGNTALAIARTSISQVNVPLKIFAAAYLLIGIIGLVVPRLIKPRA